MKGVKYIGIKATYTFKPILTGLSTCFRMNRELWKSAGILRLYVASSHPDIYLR